MHKRLGKFGIPLTMIQDNPELVREILSYTIVVRAELYYSVDIKYLIAYEAICDQFRELKSGEIPPIYTYEQDKNGYINFFWKSDS